MTRALPRRRFLAGVAATAAAAATAETAAADTATAESAATTAATAPPAQSGVESTLDELVPATLDEHGVPGAAVAVVDAGEVTTKGYGVADRGSEAPVDPAETAFRLGSVSKPVTATALMDRVQRGEIDPEAPVSDAIDASMVPDQSVTLAELITHRGGFEGSNRGLWLPGADSLRPLAAYLAEEPQAQFQPPGTVGSYSNFGYGLAGQLLASADRPFAEAIEADLLDPAGMSDSSYRQPLPESVAEGHASGHGPTGSVGPGSFPLVGLRPAGSLSATADDMARFLTLHLDDGAVDGEQVLEPGTAAATHEQWATHHESLDGMGFGLIEQTRDGTRTLWHNGATPSFYSHLVLVPDHDFGLFVATNAPDGSAAASEIVDAVLAERLPAGESGSGSGSESLSPDGEPTRADDLAGTYRSLQQSYTWHDRATSVLNAPTLTVSVADDGALVTESGGGSSRWVEIEPLVFEHEDGGRRLAFGEADGEIEYLFRGGSPTAFGRVDRVDSLTVHAAVLVTVLLGVLSADLGWSGQALYERIRAEGEGTVGDVTWRSVLGSRTNRAKLVAAGASAAAIGGVVAMVFHLAIAPYRTLSDPPVTFDLLFAGPLLGLVGAVAALGYAGRLWLSGDGSRLGRLHYTLVTASVIGLCWLLDYWNLLFPPA